MELPKIEERTLYPPIITYLQDIGFTAVSETTVSGKHPDILFKLDEVDFVVEVKIGKPEIAPKATAQAYDYAKKLHTNNIIILIYPDTYRNQIVLDYNAIQDIALNCENVKVLVLTDYWTKSLDGKPSWVFTSLKERILRKDRDIDFNTVVGLIESYVSDLNSIIFQVKTEEIIAEVVNKLDLFTAIGEIKDKDLAKRQVMSLSSYLLFNQLLFYHILFQRTKDNRLVELTEINKIQDIQQYIDRIKNIDYQSIYKVNILGHIPNTKTVIEKLNDLIKSIKLLRAEYITHDLAGRFFHDLIPFEVRKILAAFYTHSVSAEILANLTIDSWDESVIDPACGSGTLLVSTYKRKQDLYKQLHGFDALTKLHKKFIQEDITGIDIMPFAAHISTINLTTQNIEEETNVVRIACKDSLSLSKFLKTQDFKTTGILISPYTEIIQQNIVDSLSYKQIVKKGGALSPAGKGGEFYLKPVDTVIMNPPFSDREKMPEDMRNKLKENKQLLDICGNQVNLWGYFLALSHYLIKDKGKIGAVIPINLFRGGAVEDIQNFIIDNYRIKYIVRSTADIAFSEGATFRDILLIIEKSKPKPNDRTCVILLKKSVRDMSYEEAKKITEKIKSVVEDKDYLDETIDLSWVRYTEIQKLRGNLMPLVGFLESRSRRKIGNFLKLVESTAGKKNMKIKREQVADGFHTSPKGLSELLFITKPITKDRIKQAFLVLGDDKRDTITASIKNTNESFTILRTKIVPALRTLTSINTLSVENVDYMLTQKTENFDRILMLSKWDKGDLDWIKLRKEIKQKQSYVVVARRFRPNSENTHHLAFYSKDKVITPDAFKIIQTSNEQEGEYQTLILNSVLTIASLISFRAQTTGGFTDIRESELTKFSIFNIDNLTKEDKNQLDKLYQKLKDKEFPSIKQQFENHTKERQELDTQILKILGLQEDEIKKILPDLYDIIAKELTTND